MGKLKTEFDRNKKFYNENGFFVVRRIFSKLEIESIQKANQECIKNPTERVKVIHEDGQLNQPVRSVMGHHQSNRVLDQFTRYPTVIELAETIVGSSTYISQFKINDKAPMKDGKVMGKRWMYHRGFTFWHLLDVFPEPQMFSFFIYLTEQTKQNGAVYLLKGSHLGVDKTQLKEEIGYKQKGSGQRDSDTAEALSLQISQRKIEEYKKRFERVDLLGEPGDVLIMHALTLHASDENLSNESRELMISVYNSVNNLPKHPRKENYLCEPDTGPITSCQ